MIVKSKDDGQSTPVDSLDYRGRTRPVTGVKIRWLSQQSRDAGGPPAYGLRLFEVGPGGEIPIHHHDYVQTMYILSGEFECWQFDPDTDEPVTTAVCRAGDTVFIPGWEPHGMRNLSSSDAATFVCCICSWDEDRGV